MRVGDIDITNPLEILECILAFDSRDWSTDKRDFMIWAVVFGWNDESYAKKGYSPDTAAEWKKFHEKYVKMKEEYKDE